MPRLGEVGRRANEVYKLDTHTPPFLRGFGDTLAGSDGADAARIYLRILHQVMCKCLSWSLSLPASTRVSVGDMPA